METSKLSDILLVCLCFIFQLSKCDKMKSTFGLDLFLFHPEMHKHICLLVEMEVML